ncbi:hypothetical protein [uncultured Polaribacter sp.]|uniref:hypothetical protein n=1 Tax=uncultured Polaribacter sp. TaxID=174711 RepID=UPI00262038A3|nr:hypothetical protein [uncultured Polaribacter sp.]
METKLVELEKIWLKFDLIKDYKSCEPILIEIWNLIPEPKKDYNRSYNYVTYMIDCCLGLKKKDEAKRWLLVLFDCFGNRYDSGETEFIAGKVFYEANEFEEASKYFKVAFDKSRGRQFKPNGFLSKKERDIEKVILEKYKKLIK